jgi:hypothetical protein
MSKDRFVIVLQYMIDCGLFKAVFLIFGGCIIVVWK